MSPPGGSGPDLAVRKVKSAVRTVELLEYLAARHDDPARLREISDALDMPRSSAHALLRTLVAQGWVRSDATGTMYAIGVRALLVGTSYLDSDPYLPLITPFLDDLRADLDETFHLGRLDGTDIVYLATRESKQYNRVSNRVGRRLPAYATALGKALLAERFDTERDEHVPSALKPLTAKTIVDRAALDETLDEVRVRGYATDDEENTAGCGASRWRCATARPRRTRSARRCPSTGLTPQREREIVEALRTMGDKVSRVVRPWPTATNGLHHEYRENEMSSAPPVVTRHDGGPDRGPRQHAAEPQRCPRPVLHPKPGDPHRLRRQHRRRRGARRRADPPHARGRPRDRRRPQHRRLQRGAQRHATRVRRPRRGRPRRADVRPAGHRARRDRRRVGAARPARPAPRRARRRAARRRPAARPGAGAGLSVLRRRPHQDRPRLPVRRRRGPPTPTSGCASGTTRR